MIYLLIFIPIVITIWAQILVSTRYSKYSKVANKRGVSGCDVAKEILSRNGLDYVDVVETRGYLSDHFDPRSNVVRLSSAVYNDKSISSAAIAAHEVGHAIQYKEGNFFMKIRSFIVPFVNICSKLGYVAIIIGFIFSMLKLVYIGIGTLVVILFFELVTLPVEFGASRKALSNLESANLLESGEKKGAFKVLGAAALTYVAALLTTLLEIARLLLMVAGNRD